MRARADGLLLAAAGLVLAASLFFGGGSGDGPLTAIGVAALLVVGLAGAAVLLGLLPAPALDRSAAAAVGLLAAYVLWSGASMTWSIAPDASWSAFNRGLAYLALLLLGALIGALVERAPRVVAGGLAAGLALVLLWALAGKVVPALGPENTRSARLRAPVGYWNALALLLATSLPLWLWLVARRTHRRMVRAASVVALFLALVGIALTTSRGGVIVGMIAIGVWFALGRPRLESLVALLLAGPVALAVAWWAVQRPGLGQAGAAPAQLSGDGVRLAVVLAVAAALVGGAAAALLGHEMRLDVESRRRLRRISAVAAVVVLIGVLAAGVVRVGDPLAWARARVDEFRNPPAVEVTVGPERVTQFSSNHRWTWWQESASIFADHPGLGTGAATFPVARRPLRDDAQVPLAPHNIVLQTLSETGLLGLLLLAGFAAAVALSVTRTLRRLGAADRAAAAALAAGIVAYLAHALIDIGWDYVAVSAPFFVALGTLLTAGERTRAPERRPVAALAVWAVALAAVCSLSFPWLAERRVDNAYAALEDGALGQAAAEAEDAAELNPLALEPLHVQALAHELDGDLPGAERLYVDAVELQPQHPEAWYELGRFEFEARGDLGRALRYLDRSYALDRYGPSGPLLDSVRAAIAARSPG